MIDCVDFDDSSYLSNSSYVEEEEEELEYDDMENECITNMHGNRILPVDHIAKVIKEKMCSKKCATSSHKKLMKEFMAFADEYESEIKKEEENEQLFYSRIEHFEWLIDNRKNTRELYIIFCGKYLCIRIEDRML